MCDSLNWCWREKCANPASAAWVQQKFLGLQRNFVPRERKLISAQISFAPHRTWQRDWIANWTPSVWAVGGRLLVGGWWVATSARGWGLPGVLFRLPPSALYACVHLITWSNRQHTKTHWNAKINKAANSTHHSHRVASSPSASPIQCGPLQRLSWGKSKISESQ